MQTSANSNGVIEITIPDLPPRPPSPFEITSTGMTVTGRPTFEQWVDFGWTLYGMRSALQWTIGDWLLYAETRLEWQERYNQAISLFGFEYGYLCNMTSIARKFPTHARVSLSWSHHQAVAALPEPERKAVLKRAVQQKLPRDEVRAIVKEIKESLKPTPVTEPTTPPVVASASAIVVSPPPTPSGSAIRGNLSVLSVDPLTGDMLINNLELSRALKRGDFVEFIVYQKEKSS